VEHHFIGLFEEVHRPPEYPKTPRPKMAHKVFLGIPFLKKTEFIFILHTLTKVATLAALLRPYGADQGTNRLGQLHALRRKDLHSYDDQDHTDRNCKWIANKREKIRSLDSSFNNAGLD